MRKTLIAVAALVVLALPAWAQNNWVTPGGSNADGKVQMCLNSSGQAVPWWASSGTWQCAGATVPVSAGAGSNVIGKVGIDQTTFGTTNGVVNAANTYNTVAASQTAQALTGGSGGATGDYLSHCVVIPATTSPGVVTILDNSTSIVAFAGGASSVSNLVPFAIPVGAKSTSGAWKITTGANVSVACVGHFT